MFKLNLPTEPYWLTLLEGKIEVKVKPCTKLVQGAARNYQRRVLEMLSNEKGGLDALGVTAEDMPDLKDEDVFGGVAELLYAQGLGRQAIMAWRGVAVEDEEGNVLEVTPERVDELMRVPYVGDLFAVRYQQALTALFAEGNG